MISARNANTFDFVLPTTGDPTAFYLSPDISPGGTAAPIYVVDRLDIVRIFVDIPERDANFVNIGTKATVLARAFRDTELPATVTRVSWALNMKSRTLRAEIDLPNPDSQLLPGMYAYVKVIIERPDVQALPLDALDYDGDQTFCWLYESGKAVRTELETGVSDDKWIEVTNRRPPVDPEAPSDSIPWTPIDGTEQVIMGDLSGLADGAPVEIAPATAETKARERDARPPIQEISDAPSPTSSARVGSSAAPPAAGVPAPVRPRWPPWRRRGATTRRRTTIRASASLRPCGWSSRRSGTSSGSSASPASPRATSAQVGLSENERLHPEVDRGHRRQGEEGRCARQPVRARAGRGPRYEEGDGRARPGAGRAGQGGGGGGRGRRRGGQRAARGGPGGARRLPGRGRALGLGDQAARQTSSRGAWSIPRMSSRPPIGGRRASRCATRRRRPS